MLNTALLESFPNAQRARAPVTAHLLEYSRTGEGAIAWSFLYAPEEITTQKNARYGSTPVMGELPATEYGGPEARTVTLSGLILEGFYNGKSVASHAEALERLTKATVNGQANAIGVAGDGFSYSSPPVLSFVLGGRTVIAPCVLTSTGRSETAWAGTGEVMDCTLSMTLTEISPRDLLL